jgi:hypothetical protein
MKNPPSGPDAVETDRRRSVPDTLKSRRLIGKSRDTMATQGLTLLLCSIFLFFCAGCATEAGFGGASLKRTFFGPIPSRSLMPLSLIFPQPVPEKVSPLPAGAVESEIRVEYASIFVSDVSGAERILVDGEFCRSALAFRFGLPQSVTDALSRFVDGIEVGFEIPFLRYVSGRFDGFIEDWHSFFGLPQGNRDKNPNGRYGVDYANGSGSFLTAEEDGMHLADIPVTVKVGLFDPAEAALGLALRGVIELPTGDEDDGFGSGGLDGGVGFLVEKRFEELAVYFSLDQIFRKSPDSFHGIDVAHVTHGSLAAEYRLFESFSVVLQTDYQSKPLNGAHLREFVDPQWMGAVGGVFRLTGDTLFRIAIAEGLTVDSAPDFTVSAGLTCRF